MSDPAAARQQIRSAMLQHGNGNLVEAESAYREVLRLHPQEPDAQHYLGVIGLQTGRLELAIEHIQKALEIQPDNTDALINLGNAQHALGMLDEARITFERALLGRPDSAPLLANLANVLMQQGQRTEAIACYIRALDKDPSLSEARRNLADALLDIGNATEAMRHISIAAKADTYSTGVRLSLANILHANGRYVDAIDTYQTVLTKYPDQPPVMCSLAVVLSDAGDTGTAIEILENATRLDPAYAEGHYALGIALQNAGKKSDAENAFRSALVADAYCTKALRAIASLSRQRANDTTLTEISRTLALPDLTVEQRVQLDFAAGKCSEDLGDFSASARHVLAANRAHRRSYEYGVADDIEVFANIREHFGREQLLGRGNVGCDDATPIFIVGMPRSGTSLVEQILASHSAVHGGGELLHFPQAIASQLQLRTSTDFARVLGAATDTELGNVAREYLRHLQAIAPGANHVTDKLPHNFLYLGIIRLLFPGATIVHCRRDARDCCWSIYKNFFGANGHAYAYKQTELARYYRAYEDLIAHWQHVMPGAIVDVQYEELVDNQEDATRSLLEACELPWEDSCLEYYRSKRSVRTLSATQVREPVYRSSIGAWKNHAAALGSLIDALDPALDTRPEKLIF